MRRDRLKIRVNIEHVGDAFKRRADGGGRETPNGDDNGGADAVVPDFKCSGQAIAPDGAKIHAVLHLLNAVYGAVP